MEKEMEKEKNITKIGIKIWRWIFKWKAWSGKRNIKNNFIEFELNDGKGIVKQFYDNRLL